MKSPARFGLGVVLSIVWFLILTNLVFAETEELRAIQAAIKARGAPWTAGESWVTRLRPDERQKLLGGRTSDPRIAEEIGTATSSLESYADAPDAIDWRNKDGHNWITPVKNQAMCGSCTAFGAVATLESLVRIEQNQPDLDIDLSEMHLFNCGGGSCSFGWYPLSACRYLKDHGTPDEQCWPYVHFDRPCSDTCSDWQSRAVKIIDYGSVSGIEDCKTYVAIAPIFADFLLYTDFYHYDDGIYEQTWGDLEGWHDVCIVGYDTTGEVPYWIVKNSWGSSWGEDGFFRIKMGECSIDTGNYWMSRKASIARLVPAHGGYGTRIEVRGVGFGAQQAGMIDAQNGYYGVIIFSRDGYSDTMIATQYPLWSDETLRVKFKKLFVDQDGDYLQDEAEDPLAEEALSLDDYELSVNIIWFHDNNSNGLYDEEDGISGETCSDSAVFTLTDEPILWRVRPDNTVFPREIIRLQGRNLGDGSGGSVVHVGSETFNLDSPRIKKWLDTRIKIRVPNYACWWFHGEESQNTKVWVTVDKDSQLTDSNKKRLRVMKPDDCP